MSRVVKNLMVIEEFLPSKGNGVFSFGTGNSFTPLSLELDVPKTTIMEKLY